MALRGVLPKTITKRLKALFYGHAGVGKTTAVIQFPRPYLIDTEKGAENPQYVNLLEKSGGVYFHTTDFDEMLREVTALLTEKHEYRTLIIDPLTVPYNDLLDKSAKALATDEDPTGTAFGRHKGPADRKVKHLLNLLLRLDMNVIITSHAKTRWERNGQQIIDAGQTFDCYGKLDYLFDLCIELQKRGKDRVGLVRKTRLEGFPEGDCFPFNYAEVAQRYGSDELERKAAPQALATPEQIAALREGLDARKDGADLLEKWLDKAQAASLEELPQDVASKCLDFLSGKGKK